MKKAAWFLLTLSILFTACKKEKERIKSPEPEKPAVVDSFTVLTYTLYDSTFSYRSYTSGPDGYKSDGWDSSYAISRTQTISIDTLSDTKQLIYQGVSFEREGAAGSGFKKISPRPFAGEVIWITLKSDTIMVSCAYDSWQTWKKSYSLRGKLK